MEFGAFETCIKTHVDFETCGGAGHDSVFWEALRVIEEDSLESKLNESYRETNSNTADNAIVQLHAFGLIVPHSKSFINLHFIDLLFNGIMVKYDTPLRTTTLSCSN